jgi:hypothetical protein
MPSFVTAPLLMNNYNTFGNIHKVWDNFGLREGSQFLPASLHKEVFGGVVLQPDSNCTLCAVASMGYHTATRRATFFVVLREDDWPLRNLFQTLVAAKERN